jgi:hypothetical protein
MRHIFHTLRLLLAACLLTACTPARTGVIGNTLTTNVKPAISITGQSGLTIQTHGRMRPNSGTTTTSTTADLTLDYAVFTDATDVKRFAYAAIVRIDNEKQWNFQPPTAFDDAFIVSDSAQGGFQWSMQLLRVASDKDWASGVWADTGRDVPEFWLVKRWVAHCNSTTRAIMEYREPWPEGLSLMASKTLILSDSAAALLQNFTARADAAFLVEKKSGEFDTNTPQSKATTPRIPMNIPKTVGTIIDLQNT